MNRENKTLLARKKSREREVTVGDHGYTVSRPKAADMLNDLSRIELARRFTVGWTLKNIDLVPGGNPDPEPFEATLWVDWLEDNEELWLPLSDAILALWNDHQTAKEAAEKN